MENREFKILAIDDNKDNLIAIKSLISDAGSLRHAVPKIAGVMEAVGKLLLRRNILSEVFTFGIDECV